MTWEEAQRMMEFLLQQQARFDARQAGIQENQAQFKARQAQFEQRQAQFDERIHRLADIVEKNSRAIETLVDSHLALSQAMAVMRETEIRTDERLNALILTVEKLINRNGHSSH